MVTGGRVPEVGKKWLGKLGMVSRLWVLLVLVSLDGVKADRGLVAQMRSNVEDYTLPLENCDFRFRGHRSVPPIFNLQNPSLNALSSNIIARDGEALLTATTADHCRFPAADGEEAEALEEITSVCAEHFHIELDRLATTALSNLTEWFRKNLQGRHVLLPWTAVDFVDGTRLRPGDGDGRFPEPRRCVAFFTASDITTLLDKVLNKAHRKKLLKIGVTATRVRYDFNTLVNSILQFP